MSTQHWDYIPARDLDLVAWSENFTTQVELNATAWGITTDEAADLRAANDEFAELQKKVDSPARTAIIVAEKNTARKKLESLIRALVGFRLKNGVHRYLLAERKGSARPVERNRKRNCSVNGN